MKILKGPTLYCTIGLLINFISLPVSSAAQDTEWIVYGAATLDNEGSSFCFYDNKGIKTTPEGTKKVWTKCILEKLIGLNNLPEKEQKIATRKAAIRLIKGIPPKISKVMDLDKDQLTIILGHEEVANSGIIPYQSQMQAELKCSEQSYRFLHIDIVVNDNHNASDMHEKWKDIPPESNTSRLAKLVCE